jgi:hypothetical protein
LDPSQLKTRDERDDRRKKQLLTIITSISGENGKAEDSLGIFFLSPALTRHLDTERAI